MKKLLFLLFIVSVLFMFSSCLTTTTKPVSDADLTSVLVEKDYEVLGHVTLKSKVNNILGLFSFGGKGYEDMLEMAKEMYPECDAVINIYEDETKMLIFGIYNQFGKVLTGTAINFID